MKDELKNYLRDLDLETELYLDEFSTREEAFTAHIMSKIAPVRRIARITVTAAPV